VTKVLKEQNVDQPLLLRNGDSEIFVDLMITHVGFVSLCHHIARLSRTWVRELRVSNIPNLFNFGKARGWKAVAPGTSVAAEHLITAHHSCAFLM